MEFNSMIKISEMAKMANTTRRTLIFYDEQGLFCPAKKTDAGYRLYEYDQLYDLLFILGLRNLGISVDQIHELQSNDDDTVNDKLLGVQKSIDDKIENLSKIQTVINKKISDSRPLKDDSLYEIEIMTCPKMIFWCSENSASCTDEEIAQLFSGFYQQLDTLAYMDTTKSGFLTNLEDADPKGWMDAGFRVIKQTSPTDSSKIIPSIIKTSGKYISIRVKGDTEGIQNGLLKIQQECHSQNYQIDNNLWQINEGNNLAEHGGTKFQRLEYHILN